MIRVREVLADVLPTLKAHRGCRLRLSEQQRDSVYELPWFARVYYESGLAIYHCFGRTPRRAGYAWSAGRRSFKQHNPEALDLEPEPPIDDGKNEDICERV